MWLPLLVLILFLPRSFLLQTLPDLLLPLFPSLLLLLFSLSFLLHFLSFFLFFPSSFSLFPSSLSVFFFSLSHLLSYLSHTLTLSSRSGFSTLLTPALSFSHSLILSLSLLLSSPPEPPLISRLSPPPSFTFSLLRSLALLYLFSPHHFFRFFFIFIFLFIFLHFIPKGIVAYEVTIKFLSSHPITEIDQKLTRSKKEKKIYIKKKGKIEKNSKKKTSGQKKKDKEDTVYRYFSFWLMRTHGFSSSSLPLLSFFPVSSRPRSRFPPP